MSPGTSSWDGRNAARHGAQVMLRALNGLASNGRLDIPRARAIIRSWRRCARVLGGDPSLGLISALERRVSDCSPTVDTFTSTASDFFAELPEVHVLAEDPAYYARVSGVGRSVCLECSDEFASVFTSAPEWEEAVKADKALPCLAWARLIASDHGRERVYTRLACALFGVHSTEQARPLTVQLHTRDNGIITCTVTLTAELYGDREDLVVTLRVMPDTALQCTQDEQGSVTDLDAQVSLPVRPPRLQRQVTQRLHDVLTARPPDIVFMYPPPSGREPALHYAGDDDTKCVRSNE